MNIDPQPYLQYQQEKLVLISHKFPPLFVDFDQASVSARGKKLALIKACKPSKNLKILDVTAGWGRDAAQLARAGAQVLMLERNPIVHALLADGLKRSFQKNLYLQHMDAKDYLANLPVTDFPDVIYIDSMHPARRKTALVKKEMQILQQLIGPDPDIKELIELSLRRMRQRVVVKWPQSARALVKPVGSVNGKTVRFDIYT